MKADKISAMLMKRSCLPKRILPNYLHLLSLLRFLQIVQLDFYSKLTEEQS